MLYALTHTHCMPCSSSTSPKNHIPPLSIVPTVYRYVILATMSEKKCLRHCRICHRIFCVRCYITRSMPNAQKKAKKKFVNRQKDDGQEKRSLPFFHPLPFLYSSMSHNDNLNGLNQQFGKLLLFSLTQTTHNPWTIPPATTNQQTTVSS